MGETVRNYVTDDRLRVLCKLNVPLVFVNESLEYAENWGGQRLWDLSHKINQCFINCVFWLTQIQQFPIFKKVSYADLKLVSNVDGLIKGERSCFRFNTAVDLNVKLKMFSHFHLTQVRFCPDFCKSKRIGFDSIKMNFSGFLAGHKFFLHSLENGDRGPQMKSVCYRVLPPREISQSSVGVFAFRCSVADCWNARLLQLFLSGLCLIRASVNRNKTLRLTSYLSDSLMIHIVIHEGGMAGSDQKIAQKSYREKLKQKGRKQILLDLPETLISKLDSRNAAKVKRSALVEQLLEQALAGESKEAV